MKITLIVERCQLADPGTLIPQLTHLLREWGVAVKLIIPEACHLNLAHIQPTSDLYLLASRTPLALSLAGMLDALGATLINPYPVANALHNKLMGLHLLQTHGLPIPETYIATNPDQLKALLAAGPLIIKPQVCPQPEAEVCSGRLISHLRELPVTITPDNPVIAQRYFAAAERHWRVCCIGGQLLGLDHQQPVHRSFRPSFTLAAVSESWHKTFALSPHEASAANGLMSSSTELAELALRCGRAFDIDLFAITVVEHQDALAVVDMVSFPDFPEAASRLAEYLYARAQFGAEKKLVPLAIQSAGKRMPENIEPTARLFHPQYPSWPPQLRSNHLQPG